MNQTKTSARADLEHKILTALRVLTAEVDRIDQAVADLMRFHRTDLSAIEQIERHGGLTPGELAEGLGLTSGAVTTMIDRLVKAGAVTREIHPVDRRRIVVKLTPAAEAMAQSILSAIEGSLSKDLERFSDAQLPLLLGCVSEMAYGAAALWRRMRSGEVSFGPPPRAAL